MKRTSLFIHDEQYVALTRLSEETGAPIAELIRRAIAAYLHEQHPQPAARKKGVRPTKKP